MKQVFSTFRFHSILTKLFRNHLARWILGKNRVAYSSTSKLKVITNDFIGDEILSYGKYEASEIELFSIIFDFKTKEVDALDVGANIGNHSLSLAELFRQVLAFEPHPDSQQVLKINSSDHPNIRIFPFGLSDTDAVSTLYYSDKNLGKASLTRSQEKAIEIALKRGDSVIESSVGFVKIDVEGHELKVLQGLEQTIRSHQPIVAFELQVSNEEHQNVLQVLNDLGYTEFYVPYKKSLFGQGPPRRFYQRVLDDLLFSSTQKLIRLNPQSKQFQHLVFTQAPTSKYRIKKEVIIS